MRYLFILTCFFYSAHLLSQSTPQAIMKFELEGNSAYIYCNVNGTDSLKFLFDTGADGSVINERALHRVKMNVDGEALNIGSNGSNVVKLASDNTFGMGGVLLKKIPLTIIPFETDVFDGVLGTDIMRNFVIEIDYQKKEIRFFSGKEYSNDLSAYDKCKMYFPGNYLSIKSSVTVNGKTYKGLFGLDTGADNSLTLAAPFVAKNNFTNLIKQVGTSSSQGSDGSIYASPLVLIPELSFGKKTFYDILADLSLSTEGGNAATDKQGFFGNDFLKRFDTVIDFHNGNIYFKPNSLLYQPFY